MDSGLVVLYSSKNLAYPTDGHAFLIDGYDDKGKFHINWGWHSWLNGYYTINRLRGSTIYDFRSNDGLQSMTINIKPDKGGAVSYSPTLDSFAVAKTSVAQNEMFIVNAGINKQTPFPFSGYTGAALTDSKGNILTVMGFVRLGSKYSIDCTIPDTVKPGQYTIRVVTRPDGGKWEVVTFSDRIKGVPTAFNITVTPKRVTPTGGYGLSLQSFSSDKTSASRNERFTVSTHVMALKTGGFPGGQAGAALIDNNGNIAAVIGTLNVNAIRELGWQFGGTQTLACAVPNNVSPGRYRLRLMFKTADGDWRVATLSEPKVPTSVDFEVVR